MKRGQISVEYLIVVGFVVFLVLGILGVAFYYSSALRDSIKFYQLRAYVDKVIISSESVFFAGEPSKSTFTAYLPEGVTYIGVYYDIPNDEYSLEIHINSYRGGSITAYPSNVPIAINPNPDCALSTNAGVKRIEVVARGADVLITEDSC